MLLEKTFCDMEQWCESTQPVLSEGHFLSVDSGKQKLLEALLELNILQKEEESNIWNLCPEGKGELSFNFLAFYTVRLEKACHFA